MDSYLGATESELRSAPVSARIIGLGDQRRLFPHSGGLALGAESLVLGGWREIPRSAVESVALTFTDAYGRAKAAGVRGQYTSFGVFGDLGKPLVLHLRDGEAVYLLVDFRWLTGTNQARRWAPRLRQWSAGSGEK